MNLKISSAKARIILLVVWSAFFITNICMLMYLYLDRWIEGDNFKAAMFQINSLYVTYLGVMIAFFFTDRSNAALKKNRAGTAFVLALIVSVGWNVFISIFIARLLLPSGEIEDSIKQIGDFGPLLSWIIAPAIGYYFAKS